ncbi:MAG: alpha-glucan family phosphorylase [Candidatus Woesearchaeota archaeon]
MNQKPRIAYFSMEIGVKEEMETYSGGLGILAGDTLKSGADLKMPILGVTLLHEKGYFKQKIVNGEQQELNESWNKEEYLTKLDVQVTVSISGRDVKVGAWKYELTGISDNKIPIILLDTNIEGNSDYDRTLTSYLYGGDRYYRLCQEVILGVGGVKILKELGYDEIYTYHMNEGHAALLIIELLEQIKELNPGKSLEEYEQLIKKKCVFTTHTPVPAGHDCFSHEQAMDVLKGYPSVTLKFIDISDGLNMTHLALKFSRFVNGVARRHSQVSRDMFPGYEIKSITNGVHSRTWVCDELAEVFNRNISMWNENPEFLREALKINDEEIWTAHQSAKKKLIEYINSKYNLDFNIDTFTVGFARRATGYKRASLLFRDIESLKNVSEKGGIQIVFGGKAHPNDTQGKEYIKHIHGLKDQIRGDVKFIYLEDYDMALAKIILSGVDLWLNTPLRPNEASGTSGMKAAHNGVPSLSVLDGWWLEGCIEGITGWSIGEGYVEGQNQDEVDAKSIYEKLEKIIPTYYSNRKEWISIMKHSISVNASYFNTHRMIKEYVSKSYFF